MTEVGSLRPLPGFEDLEAVDARFARRSYRPHRHDTYTIGRTLAGVQRFTYLGEVRRALPGEAFVLHPDELHDGGPDTAAGYRYRAVQLPPERIVEALGGGPPPFLAQPVSRDSRLVVAIEEVFRAGDTGPEAEDALASLAEAMAGLATGRRRAIPSDGDALARRVRRRLEDDTAPARMADLEREFGIDRFTISRMFRRAFGIGPGRFQALRRLAAAKRLIRAGAPLAQAALAAGFADQSHMTRQFAGAMGLSPGLWRGLIEAAPENLREG